MQRSGVVVNVTHLPNGWRKLQFRYNEALKDLVKNLPVSSRRYNGDDRSWDVAPDFCDDVIARMQQAPHHAVIRHGVEGIPSSQVLATDSIVHVPALTLNI